MAAGRAWRVLVTGGAGFIGSAFVRRLLLRDPERSVVVLDKLTYAGNRANLAPVEDAPGFRFVEGDIADPDIVDELAAHADAIVNFAAESHVDRSIEAPDAFIRTDVYGTYVLLEASRRRQHAAYLQVSTDEVYGEVPEGSAREEDPAAPRSPYAASKAAGDLLAHAYHVTYGVNTRVTRGSNTYGPYQFPEKIIPLFTTNALEGSPLPLYASTLHRREWLHVDDHCRAIDAVLERGEVGETYHVGSGREASIEEIADGILAALGQPSSLKTIVPDRPGHDRRYLLDSSKLRRELGWKPDIAFEDGMQETVDWYAARRNWWEPLKQRALVQETAWR